MELWIRSQNKSVLIKCKSIHLESCNKDEVIYANQGCLIGKYPKERALEVLDEIQKFIIREDELSYVQSAEGIEIQSVTERGIVYEMPQE